MRHTVETLQTLGVDVSCLTITLNGEPVERVVSFDEDAGVIERYLLDHEGKVVVRDENFVTERLEGAVAAWLTRRKSDNRWSHALPEPRIDDIPRVRSLIPSADIRPPEGRISPDWCSEYPHYAAALIEHQRGQLSQLRKINAAMQRGVVEGLVIPHAAATMTMTREEAEARLGPDPTSKTVTIEIERDGPQQLRHRFCGVPVVQEGEFFVARAGMAHYVSSTLRADPLPASDVLRIG